MRSLFWKIFLWFWATVVLVGLAMVVTWSMQRDLVVNRWRASVGETIGAYAPTAAAEFEEHGLMGLNSYLETRDIHGALLDANGMIVDGRTPHAPKLLIERALRGDQTEFAVTDLAAFGAQRTTGPSGKTYVLVVRTPVLRGYPLSPRTQAVRWTLALLITGIICYILTRYLTRPILQLSAAARELAAGDLSARAGTATRRRCDEIGELVQDFDRMAERIEGLVNSQRQLMSDISHELRSPLARLNVALGLARQRAGNAAVTHLDRIEREAERLNDMIGRILVLTRMETATAPPEKTPIDLEELLGDVVADAEFEAQERGCTVQLQGVPGGTCRGICRVMGSAELLHSAVENVVRNAIRYTVAGSAIEIAFSRDGSWATIGVRDHGPGVPEAELENLFRPFYRVANARERQTGGSGLGLAIADRAVRLHGGSIRAENRPDGNGLRVEIRLPIETEDEGRGGHGPGGGRAGSEKSEASVLDS